MSSKRKKTTRRKSKLMFKKDYKNLTLPQVLHKLFHRREATQFVYRNGVKRAQCGPGRLRSIQDAYQVVKSYLPRVTHKRVKDSVRLLIAGGALRPGYCYTVKKIVHSPQSLTFTLITYKRILK